MKIPNSEVLFKATVDDPIITGNTSHTATTSNTGNTGNASEVGVDVVKKFTIRMPASLLGRIRAAYLRDLAESGQIESLSAWATSHLERAVLASENSFNQGKEFTQIDSGVIPPGRI